MAFSQTQINILKTVAYADVFNQVLTEAELYRYLISSKSESVKKITKEIDLLVEKKIVSKKDITEQGEKVSSICLKGRKGLFSRREKKEVSYKNKYNKLYHLLNYIKLISSVKALYVTGSLAVHNADHNDDIDILVVSKKGRLWITRLLLTVLLEIFRVRRKPEFEASVHNQSDKVCANMYMDETSLKIPVSKQNLYTAHEVAQADLIFSRGEQGNILLEANDWVHTFLPHTPLPKAKKSTPKNHKKNIITSVLLDKLENLAYKGQIWYMRKKITKEVVERDKALFHPRDTTSYVLNNYQARLKKLKISS